MQKWLTIQEMENIENAKLTEFDLEDNWIALAHWILVNEELMTEEQWADRYAMAYSIDDILIAHGMTASTVERQV